MLEQLQHLNDMNATRTRWRHRDDLVAAILAGDRSAFDDAISGKVACVDQAVILLHVGNDATGDTPGVERIGPVALELAERPGEIGLSENGTFLVG